MSDSVARATSWLRSADAVTVLSGAGVSTDSGIPDFRGPQGVWTRDPSAERLSTLQAYLEEPDVRYRAWRTRLDHPTWHARPSAAHRALVDVERAGKLHAIVTQNIDELHQRAGSDPAKVVEIHGTMRWAECLTCEVRTPMQDVLARVDAGEEDPSCLACGGIQKSATISFGQALKPDVLEAAVRAARSCDLFLAVGSSLTVQPAAGLCGEAVDRGARLVVMNAEPTPYDGVAEAVIHGELGQTLPKLVSAALA